MKVTTILGGLLLSSTVAYAGLITIPCDRVTAYERDGQYITVICYNEGSNQKIVKEEPTKDKKNSPPVCTTYNTPYTLSNGWVQYTCSAPPKKECE